MEKHNVTSEVERGMRAFNKLMINELKEKLSTIPKDQQLELCNELLKDTEEAMQKLNNANHIETTN